MKTSGAWICATNSARRNEEGTWDTPDAAKLLMRSVAGMHGEALAALPSASKEGASLADLIAGSPQLQFVVEPSMKWLNLSTCEKLAALPAAIKEGASLTDLIAGARVAAVLAGAPEAALIGFHSRCTTPWRSRADGALLQHRLADPCEVLRV